MQDVLRLGSEARMNTPANRLGNWGWRFEAGALRPETAAELAELMELTDRDGYVEAKEKPNTD